MASPRAISPRSISAARRNASFFDGAELARCDGDQTSCSEQLDVRVQHIGAAHCVAVVCVCLRGRPQCRRMRSIDVARLVMGGTITPTPRPSYRLHTAVRLADIWGE